MRKEEKGGLENTLTRTLHGAPRVHVAANTANVLNKMQSSYASSLSRDNAMRTGEP